MGPCGCGFAVPVKSEQEDHDRRFAWRAAAAETLHGDSAAVSGNVAVTEDDGRKGGRL
jgi:hypothetical protein